MQQDITGKEELVKVSGNPPFSDFLGFQSNAPEFQKCLMNGWSFGFDVEQDERRESRRQEAEIQERVWKE